MDKDTSIIREVLDGNTAKYELLVAKHSEKVFALAKSMLKNKEDAEEITQNVFLKAFNSLKRFKGDAKFSTYLYRICYNECLNHLRSRKVFTDIENTVYEDQDINEGFYNLKRLDQQNILKKALKKIHHDYAMVLTMFYLEDQSHKEIMGMTDWSLSAVKVKLHNARKSLAIVLNDMLKNEVNNLY